MQLSVKLIGALFVVFVAESSLLRADGPMSTPAGSTSNRPVVIAHRGASGYVPEHTYAAKAMAHAQGADFLEQDVVLTKDDVPIVLHDIHLESVTDVAQVFPGRARQDGKYYAIDFTLAEIRQLAVSERFNPKTQKAVFPQRFPAHQGRFRVSTLAEELTLIQGLNQSTGRIAGIYPELKQPAFHLAAGKDITRIVLDVLAEFHYTDPTHPCYLQCFEAEQLRRIRDEFGSRLKLVQLVSDKECRAAMVDEATLRSKMAEIATYADGIGPPLNVVFQEDHPTELVAAAHAAGLVVHPWTCRADQVLTGFHDFASLHDALRAVKIDGVFSDFPDQSRKLFDRK